MSHPSNGDHNSPVPDGLELSAEHWAMLQASAISSEVARERGYRTVTKKVELASLGFKNYQCRTPALLVPVRAPGGAVSIYQLRCNEPRVGKDCKPIKYETPGGASMHLDVPSRTRPFLGDPSVDLFITEGVKKSDAGASAGLAIIALLGVWNWRGTNRQGGKTVLPEFEDIALNERRVYLVFDSDAMSKVPVHLALSRLKEWLTARKAKVLVVHLPAGPNGAKVGLDDYLASSGTVERLRSFAKPELEPLPPEVTGDPRPGDYYVEEGHTYWMRPVDDGGTPVQLANFEARIVGRVHEDDGAEQRDLFEIECRLAGHQQTVEVPAERFEGLRWATETLGPKAIISAGMGVRDRFREAVQVLSPAEIPTRNVYRHTGWREIDGEPVYLHAGGGIGASGIVPSVETRLEPPLDRFCLPTPPTGEQLVQAVRSSLGMLEGLAPDSVVFPMFSITWSAPLPTARNFACHVGGTTGNYKTEMAALCQRHYGSTMTAECLPASWSGTANANEDLAFRAKDALLVIDDFKPVGSRQDVARAHREADRVIRGQGNGIGRQRMRGDLTLRPPRPPRGVLLSTGEEVPAGQSLQARTILVMPKRGDVDVAKLTECQSKADQFSSAMSGYIQHLAQTRGEAKSIRMAIEEERARLRCEGVHARSPTVVATLIVALRRFLRFCREVGAISVGSERAFVARGEAALRDVMVTQAEFMRDSDPVNMFAQAVGQCLQSGQAHLVDLASQAVPEPELARLAGWHLAQSEVSGGGPTREEWKPQGNLIGWVRAGTDDLFLLPDPAFKVVRAGSGDDVQRIPIGPKMLWRAMQEAKALKSHDEGRNTKKIRVGAQSVNTIHLALSHVLEGSGTSGTSGTTRGGMTQSGEMFPSSVPDRAPEARDSGTANGTSQGASGPSTKSSESVPEVPVPAGRTHDYGVNDEEVL